MPRRCDCPNLTRSLFVPVLCLGGILTSSDAVAAGVDVADFVAEYRPALDRLERAYATVVARGAINRPADRRLPRDETTIEIRAQDDRKKIDARINSLDARGRPSTKYRYIFALAGDATYELGSRPGEPSTFTLMHLGHRGPDGRLAPMDRTIQNFANWGGKYLGAPLGGPLVSMRSVLDPAKFRIAKAERTGDGPAEVVRVEFASVDPTNVMSGTVELLPRRCWALRRQEIQARAQMLGRQGAFMTLATTLEVSYGEDRDGIPLVQHVGAKDNFTSSYCDFEEIRLGETTPARQFAPSSYGLPDLTAPPADPARGSVSYWLIGLAVVALLGSVAIRRREQSPRLLWRLT